MLLRTAKGLRPYQKGYTIFCYPVAQCDTFGAFVRHLEKEWVKQVAQKRTENSEDTILAESQNITPMLTLNAAERNNIGKETARR